MVCSILWKGLDLSNPSFTRLRRSRKSWRCKRERAGNGGRRAGDCLVRQVSRPGHDCLIRGATVSSVLQSGVIGPTTILFERAGSSEGDMFCWPRLIDWSSIELSAAYYLMALRFDSSCFKNCHTKILQRSSVLLHSCSQREEGEHICCLVFAQSLIRTGQCMLTSRWRHEPGKRPI